MGRGESQRLGSRVGAALRSRLGKQAYRVYIECHKKNGHVAAKALTPEALDVARARVRQGEKYSDGRVPLVTEAIEVVIRASSDQDAETKIKQIISESRLPLSDFDVECVGRASKGYGAETI